MKARLLFLAGTALFAWTAAQPQPEREPPPLFGPLAPVLAQVQWVRAHLAATNAEEHRAEALMHSAIDFDKRSTAGWTFMADQLGLQFAAAESGRPPEERAEWLRKALDALTEGEQHVAHPETLALHRAILLFSHAETDATLTWPGSTAGLFRDAALAGEEALALHAAHHGAEAATAHVHADRASSNPHADDEAHAEADWRAAVEGLVASARERAGG